MVEEAEGGSQRADARAGKPGVGKAKIKREPVPRLLFGRRFAPRFFQPNGKNGNVSRGNATNSRGLAKGLGTNFAEALPGFALEALECVVVEDGRKLASFLAQHAVYLLALAENDALVFKVGFDQGPQFHGELPKKLRRKHSPRVVLASKPMVQLNSIMGSLPDQGCSGVKSFEFLGSSLAAKCTRKAQGAGEGPKTLVRVVLPKQKAVLRPAREHAVRLRAALGDKVIDHDLSLIHI